VVDVPGFSEYIIVEGAVGGTEDDRNESDGEIDGNSNIDNEEFIAGSSTDPSGLCHEGWVCTEWSNCVKGERIRSCRDVAVCGSVAEKPLVLENCGGGSGFENTTLFKIIVLIAIILGAIILVVVVARKIIRDRK